MTPTLNHIIKTLEQHSEVDSVFLTGSIGTGTSTLNSDIDLIIILKENNNNIRSIFTWVDGIFADIYFFDLENIKHIIDSPYLPQISETKHSMNEFLYSWIKKSDIQFDKSGELTKLKSIEKEIKISDKKIYDSYLNINYNFEANTRYFNSNDPIYHEALEIRLLYSVPEVICAYFDFIKRSWKGEKDAIKYFKENDLDFYNIFIEYTKSVDLKGKYENYSKMIKKVFELNPKYKLWNRNEVIIKDINGQSENNKQLLDWWKGLIK